MTEVLAILGAGTTAGLIALTTWLTYKLIKAKDEQLAARDLLEKTREALSQVTGDYRVEEAAHAVTRAELAKEQQLRAEVEAQRNEAERRTRDHIIEQIASSGIADAVALGNRILSAPLPSVGAAPPRALASHDGVRPQLPEVRLSDTPDGALEEP